MPMSHSNSPIWRLVFGTVALQEQLIKRCCGNQCPTISSVSPANGPVGTIVKITGTNLTGVSAVKFANNIAATFSIVSATQIAATVPPNAVTGSITLSNPGCPDMPTDTFTVNSVADLAITKTDGVTSVNSGGTTTYTIVVTNIGLSAVNGAVLTDTASPGLNITGVSCTGTTSGATCPPSSSVTIANLQGPGISIPTLPPGSSVTFDVIANVTATSGTVINTATITAPPGVIRAATDTDMVSTCPAVSRINPASGAVDDTVVITGTGFTGVTGVNFTKNVSAAFKVDSDTQITATVPNGAVTGPITISKSNCPDVTTSTFTVNSSADIELQVTQDETHCFFVTGPGGRITYTITITNKGQSTAQDVKVVELPPMGVTEVIASPPWETIEQNRIYQVVINSLPSMAPVHLEFTAKVYDLEVDYVNFVNVSARNAGVVTSDKKTEGGNWPQCKDNT